MNSSLVPHVAMQRPAHDHLPVLAAYHLFQKISEAFSKARTFPERFTQKAKTAFRTVRTVRTTAGRKKKSRLEPFFGKGGGRGARMGTVDPHSIWACV